MHSDRNYWQIVFLLAVGFSQGLVQTSLTGASHLLKLHYHISDAQYGFMLSCQLISSLIGCLSIIGLRMRLAVLLRIVIVSQLIFQGCFLCLEHVAPDMYFLLLCLCSIFSGFAFGFCSAPFTNYPALLFPKHNNIAIVFFYMIVSIGLASAPAMIGWFWHKFVWVWFCCVCILVVLSCLLRLPELDSTHADDINHERHLGSLFRDARFWLLMSIVVVYAIIEGSITNWIVLYFREDHRFDSYVSGLSLTVIWGAIAGGRLILLAMLARLNARIVWMVAPGLLSVMFVGLTRITDVQGALLTCVLVGLFFCPFYPLSMSIGNQVFSAHRRVISPCAIIAFTAGISLVSVLLGNLRMHGHSLSQIYLLCSVLPVLLSLMIWVFLRQIRDVHTH